MSNRNRLKQPAESQGARVKAPGDGGTSTQTEHLRFSFRYLNTACVDTVDHVELSAFTKRLHVLSTMTWQQVMQAPREGLGHEKIPRAQVTVPITASADAEHVLSFRYGDAQRILGRRDGALLHVLWVSHGHEAY